MLTVSFRRSVQGDTQIGCHRHVCQTLLYPILGFDVLRLSGANPAYTAEELEYQLTATKARVLLSHPGSLQVALVAARAAGLTPDRVIVFDSVQGAKNVTVEALIQEGLSQRQAFTERQLAPGEGKKKLAFLSFSSGTTGRPKVCVYEGFVQV